MPAALPPPLHPPLPDDGRPAENIAHFARALRRAGPPLGPGRVVGAIRAVEAREWEGGAWIGAYLHTFNRDWSRRVMGQGTVVLLISDGLDRDDPNALGREKERLQLSARRVIWVDPLVWWQGCAVRAHGIAAILPHVDCFRDGHSIASLETPAEALVRPDDVGEKTRMMGAGARMAGRRTTGPEPAVIV